MSAHTVVGFVVQLENPVFGVTKNVAIKFVLILCSFLKSFSLF